MTAGSFGHMRATDADREAARARLADAHAEGRLTWEEFDSRMSAALTAQTYGQLAQLTTDLPAPVPSQALDHFPSQPGNQRTSGLAIASMVAGIGGFTFVPFFGSVAAVILGHLARGQMRRTGEDGQAMAIIGLVFGYLALLGWAAAAVALGWFIGP